DNQLVLAGILLVGAQAADHIHVDHGHRVLERKNRVLAVVGRAKQSALFAAEGDEYQPPALPAGLGKAARQFHERGRARAVIVGAVVNGALGVPRQAAEAAVAQVIVVGADDDRFLGQRP